MLTVFASLLSVKWFSSNISCFNGFLQLVLVKPFFVKPPLVDSVSVISSLIYADLGAVW